MEDSELLLTDEEKKKVITGTHIDYFVDTAAKNIVDKVAEAQLAKVQTHYAKELREKLNTILSNSECRECAQSIIMYNNTPSCIKCKITRVLSLFTYIGVL